MFQHELDHLHGVLMFDRMTPEQRARGAGRVPPPAGGRRAGGPRPAPPPAPALIGAPCAWPSSARPRWRCHRCGRWSPPATTSRSSSPAPTGAAGAGARPSPSPVKAAALELGLPVTHDIDDLLAVGRRARRRRRLRADHQAARARRGADGQRALLAAAAVARRGAGRAGAAGRRRRSPASASWTSRRRSTPAACTPATRCRSARRRPPPSCAPSSSSAGTDLLVDVLAAAAARAAAAGRRGDLRRQDRAGRAGARLGPPGRRARPVVRVGGTWTTFRGRRLKVHRAAIAATPASRACSARRDGRHRRRLAAPRDGAAGGQGADVVDRLRQRRPSPPGERLGG